VFVVAIRTDKCTTQSDVYLFGNFADKSTQRKLAPELSPSSPRRAKKKPPLTFNLNFGGGVIGLFNYRLRKLRGFRQCNGRSTPKADQRRIERAHA